MKKFEKRNFDVEIRYKICVCVCVSLSISRRENRGERKYERRIYIILRGY